MNFINIAGHLGADPETRFTPSGKKVTTLRVATRTRKGGNDETIWWRVTIWGDQFDKLLTYLKKGSAVVVFGEMQKPDIFTDREGKPQISLEITASLIQFSPFGKTEKEGSAAGQGQMSSSQPGGMDGNMPVNPYMKAPASAAPAQGNPYATQGNTYDDEVPF
ncbi:MAG TPA: single-stranded DNA-binding protein [Chlamydiales bacterium]|nr:single-stranded DNA-binding protein [Chlamydiales bacterium]